jgi:hypothetical protein
VETALLAVAFVLLAFSASPAFLIGALIFGGVFLFSLALLSRREDEEPTAYVDEFYELDDDDERQGWLA